MSVHYRIAKSDDLLFAPLDAMSAVYHRPSGQTHLVGEPVPELLSVLDETPSDIDQVIARLAQKFELSAEDDAKQVIAARLDELAELGLIERGGS